MDPEKLRIVITRLKTGLTEILTDQLETLYLYGSQARGEAQTGSDIDVIVITSDERVTGFMSPDDQELIR